VIVNSRDTARDIAHFMPKVTVRVFTLPFAPSPNPDWREDRPEVLSKYGVAPPFFLISNQFWIHKDHATAFEAFRRVASGHSGVSLVCTGKTEDPRDPSHFANLADTVKSWGLDQRLLILGLIPKRDQIEIMKRACAVLQPTRFEGGPGGGAVQEAVSMNVPSIVSDLPVNREIEDDLVEFFPVGDPAALARRMEARLAKHHRPAPWADLVASGRRRRAACGEVLWQAIDFVV
jgi:glycosyltransferase involved in cell wall biosynthesis